MYRALRFMLRVTICSERASQEIRDIHASALCEKYDNNIA